MSYVNTPKIRNSNATRNYINNVHAIYDMKVREVKDKNNYLQQLKKGVKILRRTHLQQRKKK